MKRLAELGLITQTDLIKKHGWTKNMIEQYLPEPVIYTERFYSGDISPCCLKLYHIHDVYKAELTSEVKSKLVANRRKYVEKYLNSFKKEPPKENKQRTDLINNIMNNIRVVYMGQDILDELAYNYLQEWLEQHPRSKSVVDISNPDVLDKVAFTYIVQNLTTSETDYRVLNNCYCKEKELIAYRQALYFKISQVYPKYTYICNIMLKNKLKYTEKEYNHA